MVRPSVKLTPLESGDYINAQLRREQLRMLARVRELEARLVEVEAERDAVLKRINCCRWCDGEC